MTIASRIPDGSPNRCPVCGGTVFVEPSVPPGDAPCPQCGSLLWFAEVLLGDDIDGLSCEAILPDLQAVDQQSAIREIVGHLSSEGIIDPTHRNAIIEEILAREELGSTGIGNGFAVPHVSHSSVRHLMSALAFSQRGIEFNSLDHRPVHTVILLISPTDQPTERLRALQHIARHLRTLNFLP